MKRDTVRRRKLQLSKDTLRRLDPISDQMLRRVVGGSWGGVDPDPSYPGQGDPMSGRSATGSALC
ncbi:MAG TPA: hypothetical protein VMZ28_20910 [Kofleriaceae bacterium]|nr:hypothetical protein [Kofleriaceae bacterium]